MSLWKNEIKKSFFLFSFVVIVDFIFDDSLVEKKL